MTIYLGQLGRLIKLWTTPSAQVETEDYYSFQVTLEGNRIAQRRPTGRRAWSVSAEYSTPYDTGVLDDFVSGAWGPGPFVFIPVDAPVTNMMDPRAASCDPLGGMQSTDVSAGPMLTPDGWAPRSLSPSGGSSEVWFGTERVPVIDREPITVSAYVIGAGAAVRVVWYDANGGGLGGNTSNVTATAGTAVRSWLTVTPPAAAASLRVRAVNVARGSRPAVTRGTHLHPWSNGRGCPKAVVHAPSSETKFIGTGVGRQFENNSYTVTEVG